MSFPIGIYQIECLATNKKYIGSSTYSIYGRWSRHIGDLKKNKHPNIKLQNSWNKYGENQFNFSILELCKREDCINREQFYMDFIKPEFNICPKAYNTFGRKASEETKKKMSLARTGKKIKSSGSTKLKEEFYNTKRQKVTLIDSTTNEKIEILGIKKAARTIGGKCSGTGIRNAIKNKKIYYNYYWEKM